MKKLVYLLFWGLYSLQSFAQGSLSTSEVIDALNEMQVFIDNRNFRNEVVKATQEAAKTPDFNAAQYDELQKGYMQLQTMYNDGYLNVIKQDLSDFRSIVRMSRSDNWKSYAKRYATAFETVLNHHNKVYKPVLENIKNNNAQRSWGAIIPVLVPVAIDVFEAVLAEILKRREERDEELQMVLSTINNYFFKPLAMRSWEELNIARPIGGNSGSMSSGGVRPAPTAGTELPPPVIVPPAGTSVVGEASGKVTFRLYDNGSLVNMNFQETGKTTVAAPEYTENGKPRIMVIGKPELVNISSSRFESVAAYGNHTFYKIEMQGTGLIYAFALNQGTKTYSFYPQQGDISGMSKSRYWDLPPQRDMMIGRATPTGNGTNASMITIPDTANYVEIIDLPNMPIQTEQLVVLLSKSELNMKDIMQKMEAFPASTPANERLTQIFGTSAATPSEADMSLRGTEFSYRLAENDKNVLPLVFYIRRK